MTRISLPARGVPFLPPAGRSRLAALAGAASLLLAGASFAADAPPPEPRHPGGPHARFERGHAPGAGLRERELERAGATEEQRSRIRAIWKTAHEELMKLHQSQRELHRQMARLMAAPEIDANAAEALRQKISAGHDAVSKRMLQAMLDAGAVLSAEQRQKLAEHRAERQQRMERRMPHPHGMPGMPGMPPPPPMPPGG